MTCGIYQIVNMINQKIYVGSSKNIGYRFSRHKKELKLGIHHNRYLQRAWNNYGKESFKLQIIEIVEAQDKLIEREQHWLDKLSSYNQLVGYNLASKAGSRLGVRWTNEQKLKLSAKRKGRKHSEETKMKIGKAHMGKKMKYSEEELRRRMESLSKTKWFLGKTHTEETKQKLRKKQQGKRHSEETKVMMSISRTGKKASAETKEKLSKAKKNPSEETRKRLSKANKGSKNPRAILNADKVIIIKRMLHDGITQQVIADQFGVSRATIGNINTGNSWNQVETDNKT
ncbi:MULTISPECIES: NUMOD3 domain-containing DNA-binding protein [unclassified Paenibacillus]|uniref:NUMOD3 domain-containing DNA-binding protein n=1 Tax=unclassified Paenibacillus TaxID=185978 RepID=UPI0036D29A6C